MFQQFHTDTLGNRFIKSLLAQTPIPKFESVVEGDHLVKGCYYTYKRYIIQCHVSGILRVDTKEELYPSPTLYPSVFLLPTTGYVVARFYVISLTDNYSPQTHTTHNSSTNYYDSDTHMYLGKYLRYLKTSTGLNLFPYYNVFPDKYFNDIELYRINERDIGIYRRSKQQYKVCAVPILYGKTYKIYVDAPEGVLMRACLHDANGWIEEVEENMPESLINTLSSSGKYHSYSRFSEYIEFRIETDSTRDSTMQRYLYLVLQIAKDNNSSIVVLEDVNTDKIIKCNEQSVRDLHLLNLSLLKMNTRVSYAFSDRLIEYLLGNVISEYDPIARNVQKVQEALCSVDKYYEGSFRSRRNTKGTWDQDIPRKILNLVEQSEYTSLQYDHDGNINKDVEKLLLQKGVAY